MSDTPKYLNATQAAKLKGCARSHIYACRDIIGIAPGMPPGTIVFLESDVINWIKTGVGNIQHPWTDDEVVILEALICKAVAKARNTPEVYRWLHDVGLPYWITKKVKVPDNDNA